MKAAQLAILMVLLTVLGLCIVWQRVRITDFGYGIRRLERQQEQLIERNRVLTCEIAALSVPAGIEARLKTFEIELSRPAAVERLDELERATSQGVGSGTRGEQQ